MNKIGPSFFKNLFKLGWANTGFVFLILFNITLWSDWFEFVFEENRGEIVSTSSAQDEPLCASQAHWDLDKTPVELIQASVSGSIINVTSGRFKSKLKKITSLAYDLKDSTPKFKSSAFQSIDICNSNLIAQGFSLRGPPLNS